MSQPPFQPDFETLRRDLGDKRIGDWVLHPDLGVLRREDREVRINSKTLQVLLVLIEAKDKGVSRSQLLDRVWGESYPSDGVVSRAISDLRSAFGEKAGEERYLRTVPKFGYQLVAEVDDVDRRQRTPGPGDRRNLTWAWIALPILIAVIAFGLRQAGQPGPANPTGVMLPPARPLTSEQGLEHQPRLVPESAWVVYAALRSGHQDWDLFRVNRSDGSSQAVAVTPGVHEHGPAVSPSGDQLAYVRLGADGCDVVIQALVLGVPETVARCTNKFPTLVDWSHDGQRLVFTGSESDDPGGYRRLYAIHIRSGLKDLVSPGTTPTGTDFYPRFGPEDQRIAFLRGEPQPDHRSTLWMVDLATMEEKQLTAQAARITGMSWLDNHRILYGYTDSGQLEGRIYDLRDDSEQVIGGFDLIHPEYNPSEDLLIGVRQRGKRDLYLLDADAGGRFVAESTGDDFQGRLSPDENWIAFVSRRSGYEEIWIASTKTQTVRRLTRFEGVTVRYPDWSPDGDRIIFSAQTSEGERLFEVDVISGKVNRISKFAGEATSPRWLPGGENWVHGCRTSGGWSICVSDRNNTRPVATGYFLPQPLGEGFAAVVDSSGDLYRLNLSDGGAELLWQGLQPRAGWAVSGSELVFAGKDPEPAQEKLMAVDLETGSRRVLFSGSLPLQDVTISIGQVTGAVLFTRHQEPSDDLVLVENSGFAD